MEPQELESRTRDFFLQLSARSGFESRPLQLEMALAVARSIAYRSAAVIEAPTGTGKSLAYLVPAILSQKRVVIATATLALQEQLREQDVAKFQEVSGLKTDSVVAVLKGLPNYLCLRRYENLFRSQEVLGAPSAAKVLPLLSHFRGKTQAGEKVEFLQAALGKDMNQPTRTAMQATQQANALWSQVASSQDTRVGPPCRYFDECFVTKARDEAQQARVVIVNHHLFFASLGSDGEKQSSMLGEYDAVIFDEAHHLEDVATQFFTKEISAAKVERLVREIQRSLPRPIMWELDGVLRFVLERGVELFSIRGPRRLGAEPSQREPLFECAEFDRLSDTALALETALDDLELQLSTLRQKHSSEHEILFRQQERTKVLREDLHTIFSREAYGYVHVIESQGRHESFGAFPSDVSHLLWQRLWQQDIGMVCTSATLATRAPDVTADNNVAVDAVVDGAEVLPPPPPIQGETSVFSYFKQAIGLHQEVDEMLLPSTFPYAENAALYLPEMPDPRSPEFLERAAEEILALVTMSEGGAFVLTTSYRALGEFHDRLGSQLRKLGPLYRQGEGSKEHLLTAFRKNPHSILLGTSTFWEGVDVPGSGLRLVILDRIPFEVPTDPLVRARAQALEAAGGNPFSEQTLPRALLTLKQGFGRLLRGPSDHGVVAILDGRMRKSGFGKVLLRGLPPAFQTTDRAELARFLKRDFS